MGPYCFVGFCVDAARLVLFFFARVFALFDSCFCPFVLGTWGVYTVNLYHFCGDAGSFWPPRPSLSFVRPWRFARVLICFDLRVHPYLKGRFGLLFCEPLAICEGAHLF